MFFTNALIAIVAAGASAMPHFQKRTPGHVTFCTGANFTGSCTNQVNALDTCNDLPVNYTKAVTSFGPDQGAECLLMQGHCNANLQYYSIVYPGISDLNSIGEDNLATSYICLEEFSTEEVRARVLSAAH